MSKLKQLIPQRRVGYGPIAAIAALVLIPILIVAVLAATGDKPSSKSPDASTLSSGDASAEGKRPKIVKPATNEYLNVDPKPYTGSKDGALAYPDSEKDEMPKIDGVGVSGGRGWPNRAVIVKNALLIGKDLAALNDKTAPAIFKRMGIYASAGAIQQIRGLYDPEADYSGKHEKLKFVFLVNNVQTGGQHAKLVMATGDKLQYERSYTVEFGEDGKILLIEY